jgi:hypothetical protein
LKIIKDRTEILKDYFCSVFLPERFFSLSMDKEKLPLRCLLKNFPKLCPARVLLPESLNVSYIVPLRLLFHKRKDFSPYFHTDYSIYLGENY